jgi:hypothetical protein
MKTKEIIINNAPAIEGLNFRGFSGESDFPLMLNIIEKAKKADKDDRVTT